MNQVVALNTEPPPAELRAALSPTIPLIVDAAIAAIGAREPALTDSGAALERNLRRGLLDAVDRWFEGSGDGRALDLHFELGRAQARAGRSLEELMGFYRVAAQTMWRRLTQVGSERGISAQHLYHLAETGFGCVEEISTQAAEGYAEEHTHRSTTSRSRRSELVRLLLEEPPGNTDALADAASAAGVELTPALAVFAGAAEDHENFVRAARDQLVGTPRDGTFTGVLLDPGGPARVTGLRSAAERSGAVLALGPATPVADANESARRAKALLALARAELVQRAPLLRSRDHGAALLLSGDPCLAASFAAGALAPLEGVSGEHTRENLLLTLRAWLETPGQRKAIAHTLGVHPQTVRYRMLRLRELFGGALDDPDGRFELQLAMRAERYSVLAGGQG